MTAAGQPPILTVTLNPALDIATSTPTIRPEVKLRCTTPLLHPGGGGINVSRAIGQMGGQSRAFVALAGLVGQRVAQMLDQAGQAVEVFDLPGETRESFTAADLGRSLQYRYVLPGPQWDDALTDRALAQIIGLARAGGHVVLSGSQPPGMGDDFPARLADGLSVVGARLVVDISGAPLAHLATAGAPAIDVLRMDGREAESLAGRPFPTRRDSADFAADLVGQGVARIVAIARGTDGNIAVTATERWHAEAAAVPVRSKVGAGDSFVAGFTLSLARGLDLRDSLGMGAAAASATVMRPGTELCRAEDVEALFAKRVLTPLP